MKYLLILLFLFSTQVFPNNLDGKGLICDCKNKDKEEKVCEGFPYLGWLFEKDSLGEDKVFLYTYVLAKDVYTLENFSEYEKGRYYETTIDSIGWSSRNYNYNLDRKTLILEGEIIGKKTNIPFPARECSVFEKENFFLEMNNIKDNLQTEYNKKLEENKI